MPAEPVGHLISSFTCHPTRIAPHPSGAPPGVPRTLRAGVPYSLAMNAPALEVGVLLAPRPEELGEWLADARAFEAAGAAALWVDPDPESGLDPFALLAALAALTSEALLVAPHPPPATGRSRRWPPRWPRLRG